MLISAFLGVACLVEVLLHDFRRAGTFLSWELGFDGRTLNYCCRQRGLWLVCPLLLYERAWSQVWQQYTYEYTPVHAASLLRCWALHCGFNQNTSMALPCPPAAAILLFVYLCVVKH